MVKAVIFDLDGTLIQTEVMKAQSYSRTVNILTGKAVSEDKVMAGFKKYVGLSRKEVVEGLTEEFLEELTGNINGSRPGCVCRNQRDYEGFSSCLGTSARRIHH